MISYLKFNLIFHIKWILSVGSSGSSCCSLNGWSAGRALLRSFVRGILVGSYWSRIIILKMCKRIGFSKKSNFQNLSPDKKWKADCIIEEFKKQLWIISSIMLLSYKECKMQFDPLTKENLTDTWKHALG